MLDCRRGIPAIRTIGTMLDGLLLQLGGSRVRSRSYREFLQENDPIREHAFLRGRLVKFDDVPVRITDEKEYGTFELNSFGDGNAQVIELLADGISVAYFQCNMGEAGVFDGFVHQHIDG